MNAGTRGQRHAYAVLYLLGIVAVVASILLACFAALLVVSEIWATGAIVRFAPLIAAPVLMLWVMSRAADLNRAGSVASANLLLTGQSLVVLLFVAWVCDS